MNRSSTSNKQPLSKWIRTDKFLKYVGSFNWCLVFQVFTVLLPIDIHIWSLKKWIRCVLYFPYWWTQSRWTVWGNIKLPWDQVQPCETLWTRKAFHKIWDFTESFPIYAFLGGEVYFCTGTKRILIMWGVLSSPLAGEVTTLCSLGTKLDQVDATLPTNS